MTKGKIALKSKTSPNEQTIQGMGNILATPPATNYRRTLSGSNRVKVIQKLDSESIDLFYVLYIYFVVVMCAIAVIYLYSIRTEGVPRFRGDREPHEGWWSQFINWLRETPADRRCQMKSCSTISVSAADQPSTTNSNGLCSTNSSNNSNKPDGDCIV